MNGTYWSILGQTMQTPSYVVVGFDYDKAETDLLVNLLDRREDTTLVFLAVFDEEDNMHEFYHRNLFPGNMKVETTFTISNDNSNKLKEFISYATRNLHEVDVSTVHSVGLSRLSE